MSLPNPRPMPLSERASIVWVERGQIDVVDGVLVVGDKTGIRTQLPVGGMACLMLEPGTRISHAAVALAARVGCLLVWVGEGAVRVYSAGQPLGHRSDRLLHQLRLAIDPAARLKVVRRMYEMRFGETLPAAYNVEQLRGLEGARVRKMYEMLARQHGVVWQGRQYDPRRWGEGDLPNRCLSAATACLYGITEAAILAAGYAPGVGFIHTGKPLSFVYDVADLIKFETVVPAAFAVAAKMPADPERAVRLACRDAFRRARLLEKLIPTVQDVLSAGGLDETGPSGIVGPYLQEENPLADDDGGH